MITNLVAKSKLFMFIVFLMIVADDLSIWRFQKNRIHLLMTNLVLSLHTTSNGVMQVRLEGIDVSDLLQLWNINDDGRIISKQLPEMILMALPRKSKDAVIQDIGITKQELKDIKKKQDQTFTFLVRIPATQVW
jgi:hypothetical protein